MKSEQMRSLGCVVVLASLVLMSSPPIQASDERQLTRRSVQRPIAVPKLTVLSPNGEEQWSEGSYQEVVWSYPGPPTDKLRLTLFSGTVPIGRIADVAAGAGTYGWIVGQHQGGSSLRTGPYYKIKAEILGKPIYDFSDGVFAIANIVRKKTVPVREVPEVLVTRSCTDLEFSELSICTDEDCHPFRSSCFPYRCDPDTKMCRKECAVDSECKAPARCKDSRCVVPAWRCLREGPHKHQVYDGIDTYVDCSPFRCLTGPFCPSLCTSTGECQYPLRCNAEGRCVPVQP